MSAIEHKPGHAGVVTYVCVSNARRVVRVEDDHGIKGYGPGEWGVRMGSRYYPDYATPHPTAWDGMHGGHYMTPNEADELAEHLRRCAAWARAQELVAGHD